MAQKKSRRVARHLTGDRREKVPELPTTKSVIDYLKRHGYEVRSIGRVGEDDVKYVEFYPDTVSGRNNAFRDIMKGNYVVSAIYEHHIRLARVKK
jgi:hypothetical protein